MAFENAVRTQAKLRVMFTGPPKSGKTTSAVRLAMVLGGSTAVLDSEQGKARLLVGDVYDGVACQFGHEVIHDYSPMEYTSKIHAAAAAGFQNLVIDGLSHAWMGEGGALDMHDSSDERNSFYAWRPVTKAQNKLMESILNYPGNVLATMRCKVVYVMQKNDRGKDAPVMVGLKPIQREGTEYEFDIIATMDGDHVVTISGSRCPNFDGRQEFKPGKDFWTPLIDWSRSGKSPAPLAARTAPATDEQVREIRQLWVDMEKTLRVEQANLFRRYTVKEVHQLNTEQAREVLIDLKAEMKQFKPAAAAAVASSPVKAVSPPLAAVSAGGNMTLQEALSTDPSMQTKGGAVAAPEDKSGALQDLANSLQSYYVLLGLNDGSSPAGKEARRKIKDGLLAKLGVPSFALMDLAPLKAFTAKLDAKIALITEQNRSAGASCAAGPSTERVTQPHDPSEIPH